MCAIGHGSGMVAGSTYAALSYSVETKYNSKYGSVFAMAILLQVTFHNLDVKLCGWLCSCSNLMFVCRTFERQRNRVFFKLRHFDVDHVFFLLVIRRLLSGI